MEKQISTLLTEIISEKYNIKLNDIKLEIPPKKNLGDFAFGCFILSKQLKKNPIQISEELASSLDFKKSGLVSNLSAA